MKSPSTLPVSTLDQFTALFPFTLDNFQLEAVRKLIEGQSVLVSAPTGAGKTVVAEFAVFDALARGVRTIYTTPLKALSNQKYRDLMDAYGDDQVGLVTGDLAIGPDRPVLVMTTEILRNILYQDLARLEDVQYVVLDECHYMNDDERGTVWEEILIHCPAHIQIVALSATVPNASDLAQWIGSIHRPMAVIEHAERPVPLRPYYYTGGRLQSMISRSGETVTQLRSGRAERGRRFRGRPADVDPVKLLQLLQQRDMLPAIYFVFSRRGCDMALEECLGAGLHLTSKMERNRIRKAIAETLTVNPTLAELGSRVTNLLRALPTGIAIHHAGILPLLKHLIEVLFQRNLIKAVFATETLAAGINMPARTTIISSLSKRTDSGHRVLTTSEFAQMTGRAGRRGMDPVGFCAVIDDGYQTATEALSLVTGTPEAIESHFTFSYNMILNLLTNFTWEQIQVILRRSYGQYQSNREVLDLQRRLLERSQSLQRTQVPCPERPDVTFDVEPLPDYEDILYLLQKEEEILQQRKQQWVLQRSRFLENAVSELPIGSCLAVKAGRKRSELGFLVEKEWSGRHNQWHLMVQTARGLGKIAHDQLKHLYSATPPASLQPYPASLQRQWRRLQPGDWLRGTNHLFPQPIPQPAELLPPLPNFSEQPAYQQHQEAINALKERLRASICHDCPSRWQHQQAEMGTRHLRVQIRALEDEIQRRQELYVAEFWRFVDVLRSLGHLSPEHVPTESGRLTAHIRTQHELLVAEMIRSGIFDPLSAIEAAALLSCVVYDGRHHLGANLKKAPPALGRAVERTYRLASDIEFQQRQRGLERPIRIDLSLVIAVVLWGGGWSWGELVDQVSLDDGDLVRSFRQIIDLLHQLKVAPGVPTELTNTFIAAIAALDRDVVSASV